MVSHELRIIARRAHHIHGNVPAFSHEIEISSDMTEFASSQEDSRRMNRTCASPEDSYLGILGECVWFSFRYGNDNWLQRALQVEKGKVDDPNPQFSVEVKASKTRELWRAHLMVREDYLVKRKPDAYALILFSELERKNEESSAHVVGFATHEEVLNGVRRKRYSTKTKEDQGYWCREVPVEKLHAICGPWSLARK